MGTKITRCIHGEIDKMKFVKGFLPSPNNLVLRGSDVKVMLLPSQRRVDFFNRAAAKRRVPIRACRTLVDEYTERKPKALKDRSNA